MRVCAVKGTEHGVSGPDEVNVVLRVKHGLHDRAALWGLVGQAGQERRLGQLALGHVVHGDQLGGVAGTQTVVVPVSRSVDTSPAASTARPDMASTLRCTSRSMPAMPMADSSPPIVVGMRQTNRATSTTTLWPAFA